MKVLQLGKFYPLKGGVEKVIYALAEGLSARGIKCDILFAGCDGHTTDFDINENSHVFICEALMEAKATKIAPSMVSTLRKICNNYDIIHVHHPDPMAALALYTSGYKGKVVLHWHCDIVRQNKLLVFYRPLQDWLIRRARVIVGTTPVYVKHSPALKDVQAKCCYIPIGIYETQSNAAITQEIQQRYKGRRIVFSLGRLVLYKGYEYLIEAAKYLNDDYVVLIGGTGHQRHQLENLIIDNGLQEKVYLIGHIPDNQLGAYFDACKVFCLTSIDKREAFAIVQAKAMYHCRPVVSTDISDSGVPWVNKHGVSGINVPPRDSKAVARAIHEVCEDEARYLQYCQQARQRYEELFRMEDMISAHQSLYEKLMSSKKQNQK
ncbi:MAG: glycosyltransferase [Bacteroidaceae bacterium]|nr:glycosyltransferase [Bacteroidaceae bacterium]